MANVFDNIIGTKHWVCESSRLGATNYYGHMADLVIDKEAGRDNGEIVCAGNLNTAIGIQTRNAKDAVAGEPLYLLLTPPLAYNTDRKKYTEEGYFYNAKNEVARGYELQVHDVYTISAEAITPAATAPVEGQYVYWDPTSRKYIETATVPVAGDADKDYLCFCQIIEKVDHFNPAASIQGVSYRLQVLELDKFVAKSAG